MNTSSIVETIVSTEWEAFQVVQNQGGRASCQDDRVTFSIMRQAQFVFWNESALQSYLQDLLTAQQSGRNLMAEKYARMMEYTAPEEYRKLQALLPPVSSRKKEMADAIVNMQIAWQDACAQCFPKLFTKARPIRAEHDTEYQTSFETYLRGELLTYSEETLSICLKQTIQAQMDGLNLLYIGLEYMVQQYGYPSPEAAEMSIV